MQPELDPERLAILLRALASRRDLPGAILEIGCYRGGTALEAYRALRLWDAERHYVCIDTFEGFVDQQFEADEQQGTPTGLRAGFDVNSARTVRRLFRHHGYDQAEVVQGDIATLPDSSLPEQVSVCLVDVDLAEPTLSGLRRAVPRLVPGGIALVDDCGEGGRTAGWRAGEGYSQFCREMEIQETFDAGFGIVHASQ